MHLSPSGPSLYSDSGILSFRLLRRSCSRRSVQDAGQVTGQAVLQAKVLPPDQGLPSEIREHVQRLVSDHKAPALQTAVNSIPSLSVVSMLQAASASCISACLQLPKQRP